jgi:hypothetical protein
VPLLFAISPAFAWNVETTEAGDPLRWIDMPIAWSFDPNGAPPLEDDVHGAVAAAFDAWSSVEGADVWFDEEMSGLDIASAAHDLVNLVYFDVAWPSDEPALALASTWSQSDGTVVGFDIRIDASAAWSIAGEADAYDLQAALTHEIGHALGLEHSDLVEATMFGVHARGEAWRRELHDDDRDAVRHLYAQRRLDDGVPALLDGASWDPRADLGPTTCGPSQPAGWTLLPAIFVLLSMRVRGRLTRDRHEFVA